MSNQIEYIFGEPTLRRNKDAVIFPIPMQAELKHLRKENKRLKLEREILKKAAAFFAKELG